MFADIRSNNQITMRGLAERNAINTPVRVQLADIIKIAMITAAAESWSGRT